MQKQAAGGEEGGRLGEGGGGAELCSGKGGGLERGGEGRRVEGWRQGE